MKYIFLIILIIKLASCNQIKENKFENSLLEALNSTMITNIWKKSKNIYIITLNFLKKLGIYEKIINIIKNKGKEIAILFCYSCCPKIICDNIIEIIIKIINL